MGKESALKVLYKGIFERNPIFVLVLGLCPTLAVTTSIENSVGMGLATLFVLVGSSAIVSLIKSHVPANVRIPSYIMIIASFVTIADLLMQAYSPELSARLGIFVPLIVVNCIVLGRSEAFASHEPLDRAVADAVGAGVGFTLALLLLGSIREVLGTGGVTLLGSQVFSTGLSSAGVMILSPGAFITLGLLLGLFNRARRAGR